MLEIAAPVLCKASGWLSASRGAVMPRELIAGLVPAVAHPQRVTKAMTATDCISSPVRLAVNSCAGGFVPSASFLGQLLRRPAKAVSVNVRPTAKWAVIFSTTLPIITSMPSMSVPSLLTTTAIGHHK